MDHSDIICNCSEVYWNCDSWDDDCWCALVQRQNGLGEPKTCWCVGGKKMTLWSFLRMWGSFRCPWRKLKQDNVTSCQERAILLCVADQGAEVEVWWSVLLVLLYRMVTLLVASLMSFSIWAAMALILSAVGLSSRRSLKSFCMMACFTSSSPPP